MEKCDEVGRQHRQDIEERKAKKNVLLTAHHLPHQMKQKTSIWLNKHSGRRKVRKSRVLCYKKMKKLRQELERERRNRQRLEKRLYRMKLRSCQTELTPRRKTRQLLKNFGANRESIRKELETTFAVHNSIKHIYHNAKTHHDKQQVRSLLCNRVVKK